MVGNVGLPSIGRLLMPYRPPLVIAADFDGSNDAAHVAGAFPGAAPGANGEFMLSVWAYPLDGPTSACIYFCGSNLL